MVIVAGVLALQGNFAAHCSMLRRLGCKVLEVTAESDLNKLDVICLPGGESTTLSLLLDTSGLRVPLSRALLPRSAGGIGLPCLATCAGAILLAKELTGDGGSLKVTPLGLLDARINRNGYGRQVDSFEASLQVDWQSLDQEGSDPAFHGVFIRAPRFESWGTHVQVAAKLGTEAVMLKQDNLLAASFHPELSADSRLHQALISQAEHRAAA